MPSYNYYTDALHSEVAWQDRFPEWTIGYQQWKQQPPLDLWTGPTIYDWFPEGIEAPPPPPRQNDCPRLFVSHRSNDDDPALRIAWLAAQEGWDYWIDALDPCLATLARLQQSNSLTPGQVTLATAAIIEFGLLNCSHLLVVMTGNTCGSMWVPYEYGRVKDPVPLSTQVSCWRHPELLASDCPEYLVLGKTHFDEDAIRGWLRWEMNRWQQATRSTRCVQGARARWDGVEPARLPSEENKERAGESKLDKPDLERPEIDIEFGPGHVLIGDIPLPINGYSDEP